MLKQYGVVKISKGNSPIGVFEPAERYAKNGMARRGEMLYLFGHPLDRVWNFHPKGIQGFRGKVNLSPLVLSSTARCLGNRS